MQAQEYALAKWAIGQRARSLVDGDLDRALEDGSIVRTHVLRPTWHFVARDDLRWLLALTGPRVRRSIERRFRDLGLDQRTLSRCETAIMSSLEGGNRLTRNEIAGVLDDTKIDRSGQRLPFILLHCELGTLICSGGLSGKQHTYALVDERFPKAKPFDRDEALAELARRYLAGHGPATVQDLRWWSSLTLADIRTALGMLGSDAVSEEFDGVTFWWPADSVRDPRSGGGLQLLHAFDELIVGYTQSRFFGDPSAELAREAWQKRGAPNGVVLDNARIAGLWRRSVKRDSIVVEAFLFEKETPKLRRELEAAVNQHGRFHGTEASVETTLL